MLQIFNFYSLILDIIYLIILNNKNLIKMNLYLKIYLLMFGR